MFILLLVFGMGVVSSAYPAIILGKRKSVSIMKKSGLKGPQALGFRNILVVFQFAVSILLLIGTAVLFKQLQYIKNIDLGYDKENIVNLHLENESLGADYEIFKNELLKHNGISDVTASQTALYFNMHGGGADWEGRKPERRVQFYSLFVESNFLDFYGINLAEGRSFDNNIESDRRRAYIVNQKAVEEIGWEDAVGKKFRRGTNGFGTVIGVINDFNFQSLHLGVEPLAISMGHYNYHKQNVAIKIAPGKIKEAIAHIEATHTKLFPGYAINYQFLDARLNELYKTEQKLGKLFGLFAIIAVFVACMGLFGLASFMAKQRTKEIGVRKVNGATLLTIFATLNAGFARWVILSFILSCPIAYLTLNKWLNNFAYKTQFNWWIFLSAGLLTFTIAVVTVSFQSYKTAIKNPVEALKYE